MSPIVERLIFGRARASTFLMRAMHLLMLSPSMRPRGLVAGAQCLLIALLLMVSVSSAEFSICNAIASQTSTTQFLHFLKY